MFYNNQRSGYEEIKSYYPVWYGEIKEMDAIFRLAGSQLDEVAGQMDDIIINRFISIMDEPSLDANLKYLELEYSGKSVEEKRSALMAAWNGSGKISGNIIKRAVKTFLGQDVKTEISFSDRLTIYIYKNKVDDVVQKQLMRYLSTRIPAHIAINYRYSTRINSNGNLYVAPYRMDYVKISASPCGVDKTLYWEGGIDVGTAAMEHVKISAIPYINNKTLYRECSLNVGTTSAHYVKISAAPYGTDKNLYRKCSLDVRAATFESIKLVRLPQQKEENK